MFSHSGAKADVVLAVAGKFHAFSLAREYEILGRLNALYCAHRTLRPSIPVQRYHNRIDLALLQLAGTYCGWPNFSVERKNQVFGQWVTKALTHRQPGILHGWNGCMNETFRKLEGTGWLRCVERSCPHNQFQFDLLKEEASRVGVRHAQDTEALKQAIEELYLSDVIICPSQYSAKSYNDPVLRAKLRRVPLGGNFPFRQRQAKKDNRLRILMVGNSFLRKGTHYLVEAMKLVDHPDVELWVRGDVPESYRRRIRDSRIKIVGLLRTEKLRELYASADVFVQASVDEGFGMTVLEALSYGLPLVVTENVGARDILTDKVSITVPIRSPEAIATAMPKALELVGEAFDGERRRILETYTWRRCAEQLLKSGYVRGGGINTLKS